MAEKDPTLTVDQAPDDAGEEVDEIERATAAAIAPAPEPDPGPDPEGTEGFSYDEQTLGRSASVFDAGVDLLAPTPPPLVTAPPPIEPPLPEPSMSSRERRRRVRLEARRVRRVIRHFDLWSVLKISVIFYVCLWVVFMLAGVLLWSFAEQSGTLTSVEDLTKDLFDLDEDEDFWSEGVIFRVYATVAAFLAMAGVAFNVLLAGLYNLISDLTGGIRVTVIEEESARFRPPSRRVRR